MAPPLLSSQTAAGSETETSLTDILVRKPSTSSSAASGKRVPCCNSGNLNPNVMFDLFSMYREWQEEMAKQISERQRSSDILHMLLGERENMIETTGALVVKLLQRFNYSVASMRSTFHNLVEVHPLQVEVGELKGRLTEVISNCDALCKRITAEGPENLQWLSNLTPLVEWRRAMDPLTQNRSPELRDKCLTVWTADGCNIRMVCPV